MIDKFERVEIRTREQWRAWLTANHGRTESIWLVTFRRGSGEPSLPYDDIVEEALCFGWIDGRAGKLDDRRRMLLLSPRRRGSGWSKLNKERIERLAAAGLITPAGLAKIEAAKADGSWSLLDEVDALIVPPDLEAAFASAEPQARAAWDGFSKSSRRAILDWLRQARRPETRARRIEETVAMAARGLRANFPADRAR